MAKFSSLPGPPPPPPGSALSRPALAHLHLWQQRTRSSCCTRSDRNCGRQRGRRMWDSSSGRQGPLCSRSYLTQANAASKTCHGTERKLCSHSSLPGAMSPGPPVSIPPLPTLRQSLGPIQLSSYLSPEVTAFCFLNLPHLAQPLERQASVTVTASRLSLRPANKKLPIVSLSSSAHCLLSLH